MAGSSPGRRVAADRAGCGRTLAIAALVVLAPAAWPSPATADPKGRANASDVDRGLLGGASGFLLTARHEDRARFVPWAGPGGGGIDVAMRF